MPLKPTTDGLADLPRSSDETRDANLIRATTDLYIQDATHDRDQNRRYEELAIHFLPKIGLADRAYVSRASCRSTRRARSGYPPARPRRDRRCRAGPFSLAGPRRADAAVDHRHDQR